MRKLGQVKIGDKMVIVRELTVAQVDRHLVAAESQVEPTTLDWLFAESFMPQTILEDIIERPVSELLTEETAPSDLEPLYQEALRLNPYLGKALAQMRRIGEIMERLSALEPEETKSPEAPGSVLPPST